jgi:hypothetical protein
LCRTEAKANFCKLHRLCSFFLCGREQQEPSEALPNEPAGEPAGGAKGATPLLEPFGWNYKPAEKYRWLIFRERKILFRLKKQAE